MHQTQASSLLEDALYGEEDVFRWDEERRIAFQVACIRDAFGYHFSHCQMYRAFCEAEKIRPDGIDGASTLTAIPLIPTAAFKSMDICSVPKQSIAKVCRSSGTRGSVSRVPRDDLTLERFVGSVRIAAEKLLGVRDRARIFNLGPDSDEAGDIWFPYVMSLLGLLRTSDNYVKKGIFNPQTLLGDLATLEPGIQPILVGPPVFFIYLFDYLERSRQALDLSSTGALVVTAGGWKGYRREQISPVEFQEKCARYLGLAGKTNVRDAYNMVELNSTLFECEFGRKHIPPWLLVEALDPETLKPLPRGETGLLGFLDPLATSYPGFILSDDFGRVHDERCPCGRTALTFEFDRRVKSLEERGCALTMDRDTTVTRTAGSGA